MRRFHYGDGLSPYSRYRWVRPDRECRTKEEWPYSYSEFFIWGTPEQGDDAAYSDRLYEWSCQKDSRLTGAWERANAALPDRKRFDQFTQKDADKFMSGYEGKPLKVTAIAEGCNVSNGYPYWILWFHEKANPSAEPSEPPRSDQTQEPLQARSVPPR